MKISRLVYLALLVSLLLHLPTLTGFFTHDDFFHFLISRADNLSGFLNFFNPLTQPLGYGWYRPVANQLYYFLGWSVFSLNPLPMRLLLLLNHLANIFLVGYFVKNLTGSHRIAGLAAFLYASSAALFASVYLVGVQERPLTFFFLISVIFLFRYLTGWQRRNFWLGFAGFLLALGCKESAIVIPAIYLLLAWFLSAVGDAVSRQRILLTVFPMFLVVFIYLLTKFFFFGFARGDSYVWQLSPRVVNTFGWYGLWSVNIPEMWVDYIGPGFRVNPNLLRFWSPETLAVGLLFTGLVVLSAVSACRQKIALSTADKKLLLFGLLWFVITISPVLGLPLHKFPHYLAVPLVGWVMVLATVIFRFLSAPNRKCFLIAYFLLFLVNFGISTRTHWAHTGQQTAGRVHTYIQSHRSGWPRPATLVFYDTPADEPLPWTPSSVLKTVLSDNGYFALFYPGDISAVYLSQKPDKIEPDQVLVAARQFLGY